MNISYVSYLQRIYFLSWAAAPHVPAINVCVAYRFKVKHAMSVPRKVQLEVKAKTSNPVLDEEIECMYAGLAARIRMSKTCR